MTAEPSSATVDALAKIARLAVPDEDRGLLAEVLAHHLATARQLEVLDVEDVEPIVAFDPRWT